MSDPTKADLAAQLHASQERVMRMTEVDRTRDADARAIDLCVKALDALRDASRNSRSSAMSYTFEPGPAAPVERILGYLRQRYGIADPAGERDALRAELDRAQRELETLRRRFSTVYEAVQG